MPIKATWMAAAVNSRKKFLDTREISSFLWVSSLSYRRPARRITVSHIINKRISRLNKLQFGWKLDMLNLVRSYLTALKLEMLSGRLWGLGCKNACNLPAGSDESVLTILWTGTFGVFCPS